MMKNQWRFTQNCTCVLLAATLFACGGSSGGAVVSTINPAVENLSTESTATTEAPELKETLDGTWTTGCFQFQGGGSSRSRLLTLVINQDSSVFTTFSYSDLDCSIPVIPVDGVIATESSNTDRLEFPDETVTTTLGEASFINFTNESFTTDGMTTPGSGTLFSIYLIDDDGQLFFGDGAGTTAQTRPLTLDVFFFYTRL